MVGRSSAWTHAVSKLKKIQPDNALMAMGSGKAFMIGPSCAFDKGFIES